MSSLIDAILGLVIVEALALAVYHAKTSLGIAPRAYLPNLAAGFCLLFTVRLALGDAPEWMLAVGLLAALCAHMTDLAVRWMRR